MSAGSSETNRLGALDALRGLAAVWVAMYHFSYNWQSEYWFPTAGLLTWVAQYGYLAVQLFFVISGFVIPFSLDRSKYQSSPSQYGRFLTKRIFRLHPLFLINVAFCSLIMTLPAGWSDLWPHFFYLNDVMGRNWYLQIYWTLALEIQYALAIPLIFPLLIHPRKWVRWATLAAFLSTALLVKSSVWFPHYAGFYALGMLVFWKFTKRENWIGLLLGLAACTYIILQTHGTTHLTLGLVTVAVILIGRGGGRFFTWLAEISYAMYLFHILVGHRILAHAVKQPRHLWADTGWVLLAIAASLAAAWVIHRFIEMPIHRLTSSLLARKPAVRQP